MTTGLIVQPALAWASGPAVVWWAGLAVVLSGTVLLLWPSRRTPVLDSTSWSLVAAERFTHLVERRGGAAVLTLDLDHLSRVNTRYGRAAGDGLLDEVGRVVTSHTRPGDYVARRADGQFTVLVAADQRRAVSCAEQMCRDLRSRHICRRAGRSVPCRATVSIGVAVYPSDGRTLTDLVVAADVSLFAAKNGGRDRVHCGRDRTVRDVLAS